MKIIEIERLILRTWKDNDADEYYRINQDPKVIELLLGSLTMQEVKDFIASANQQFAKTGYTLFAAEEKISGKLMGFIGLSSPTWESHFTPCVEIGWRLGSQYWNKGYATEGAKAVLKYAFETVGLKEIVSFTVPANIRSIRIMEKIGMVRDIRDDFLHPKLPSDHLLSQHILYRIQRPMNIKFKSPLKKDDLELHILNDKYINQLEKLACDSRIWKYAPHPYHEPNIFQEKWLKKAMEQMQNQERVCFVIFYKNKLAGSTSYYNIDVNNKKLTIGHTWLHPDYWGSKINRLIKLIMLNYAFNTLNFIRVEFEVDSLNIPSQNALNKLGIKQEGILRNHMILSDGRIRHTCIYSVIPEEWPEIKKNIENLI